MKYKNFQLTKVTIQTKDGKEYDLTPHVLSISSPEEETQERHTTAVSLPYASEEREGVVRGYICPSLSIFIPWSSVRFRVGPFWLPPPPPDRVN